MSKRPCDRQPSDPPEWKVRLLQGILTVMHWFFSPFVWLVECLRRFLGEGDEN